MAGSSDRVARRLRRSVARGAARVDRLGRRWARGGAGRVELLHDLHRELRRLRVGMRLLEVATPESLPGRQISRDLRRLARAAGRARDRDVLGELAGRLGRAGGDLDRRRAARLARAFGAGARRARTPLLRALRRDPGRRALREMTPARGVLPRPGRRNEAAAVRRELRRRARRVAVRWRAARNEPTPARRHRLRRALRSLRTTATFVADALDRPSPPWPDALGRLQRRLGDAHNWDVLVQFSRRRRYGDAPMRARVRAGRDAVARRAVANLRKAATGRRLRKYLVAAMALAVASERTPLPRRRGRSEG